MLAVVGDAIALVGDAIALIGKPLAPGYRTLSLFTRLLTLIAQLRALLLKSRIVCLELLSSPDGLSASLLDLSPQGFTRLLHPGSTQPLHVGSVRLQLRQLPLVLGAPLLELGPFDLTALRPPCGRSQVALRTLLVHAHRVLLAGSRVRHLLGRRFLAGLSAQLLLALSGSDLPVDLSLLPHRAFPLPVAPLLGTRSTFGLNLSAGRGPHIGEPLALISGALPLVGKPLALIGDPLTLVRKPLAPISGTCTRLQIVLVLFDIPLPQLEPIGSALASYGNRFAFLGYPLSLRCDAFALQSDPLPLPSKRQQLIEPQTVEAFRLVRLRYRLLAPISAHGLDPRCFSPLATRAYLQIYLRSLRDV